MKKLVFIIILLNIKFSFSQNQENYAYATSNINIPNIKQSETFFYTEYEFMLSEKHKTQSEIEAEIKKNNSDVIKYSVSKTNNGTVIKQYIKGNIYCEKTYKNNVLNGLTTFYLPSGTVFQEIIFENGKINGLYKIYNNNNQIILETLYKNNLKNGSRKFYNTRKKEILEGNYLNGNLVGNLKFTTENSYYLLPNDLKKGKVQHYFNNKLISEFNIINQNKIHGEAIIYFNFIDKIAAKIPYYLGKKNGIAKFFDKEGNEIDKIEYKNDKKIGDYISYTKNNQINNEEHYDQNGNKTGIWKEYKNGFIYLEQTYNNDKLNGPYKYYQNGKLQIIEEYKNGKRNGKSETYNIKTGNLSSLNVYEKDATIKSIVFYDGLKIFSIYENDSQTQLFSTKFFNSDGKLLHQNNYNQLKNPIGIHKNYTLTNEIPNCTSETHYNSNGNKTKYIYPSIDGTSYESNYRNETLHGEKLTRNKNNEITLTEYYYETKNNSKKVTKDEFESLTKAEKK